MNWIGGILNAIGMVAAMLAALRIIDYIHFWVFH